MSSPRRPSSPAVKTPLEDDDLLSEIILRLPSQPSSLPRASLVCKRWHGLASDPGLSRRFRRHHRGNPPILGFFYRHGRFSFVPTLEAPNRVPRGRFSLQHGEADRFMPLGCRHGLVLIIQPEHALVWDPVTGDQHRLAIPPGIATHAKKTAVTGAVLRAGGEGAHFQVVLTVADNDDKQCWRALACVYSSETGLWGDLISTPLPEVPRRDYYPTLVFPGKTAVLVANCLYWVLAGNFQGILEFDLEKQSLAVIRVPVHMLENYQFWIMRAEGGGLGLLLLMDSSIQLWKRRTDCDGVASWALRRTIELDKLLFLESQQISVLVLILGFAEENNVLLLWTCGIIFMIHLELLQFKKLCETDYPCYYRPFEGVYTSGLYGVEEKRAICAGAEQLMRKTSEMTGAGVGASTREPGASGGEDPHI